MACYEVTDIKPLYNGLIFNVVQETVILPNGEPARRDILLHNGAAAVIPVMDDGRLIFVRQYREAASMYVLEIPAGKLDKEEDPLVCAYRELEEETGYKASSMRRLMSFYTAIGYSSEIIHLYLAEGLMPGTQQPDDDEFVSLEIYTLEAALEMIDNGAIVDAKTISALLYYARIRA